MGGGTSQLILHTNTLVKGRSLSGFKRSGGSRFLDGVMYDEVDC